MNGFFVVPRVVIGGANGVCFERASDGVWGMTDASLRGFLDAADSDEEGIVAANRFVAEHAANLEEEWRAFARANAAALVRAAS